MTAWKKAVLRIAGAAVLWVGLLAITGEFQPGGAFTLYTSMLVLFIVQQVWSAYRSGRAPDVRQPGS